MDELGHARLAEFGLASISNETRSFNPSAVGNMKETARWMAPELLGSRFLDPNATLSTKASDIYAFGMVVIEVIAYYARSFKGSQSL